MKNVEMYTTPFCGFCHAAKRLLDTKGVAYVNYDVSQDPALKAEMIQRAEGRRTVPQIFIDDRPIGGFDQISALDRAGKLDGLLAA